MAIAGSKFSRASGAAVRELGSTRGSGGWYTPHMAAAARAFRERTPLVDLVVEVRDARIPLTPAFQPLKQESYSDKHVLVLNKVDIADHSMTELLNLIRNRIRELKGSEGNCTATVQLTGIPYVGKSAIAISMHQIGRISAEEKGKLKHAVISSQPGKTKDISSYKIASHPNAYILDTPGVLFPEVADDDYGSKLALTGAIKDSLLGEHKLAQFFLVVHNSAEEYRCWENLKDAVSERSLSEKKGKCSVDSDSDHRSGKQYSSDHTQIELARYTIRFQGAKDHSSDSD